MNEYVETGLDRRINASFFAKEQLSCPVCGCPFLHIKKVHVSDNAEDAGLCVGPESVGIEVYCESCMDSFILGFYSHEGAVFTGKIKRSYQVIG